MEENLQESRPLAMTPTWSIATVMAMFVTISMVVERSIQSLSKWLTKNNKISLVAALEKMKEEMMLLGFISLLLTATSSIISSICIPSQWYNSTSSSSSSSSCSRSHIDKDREKNSSKERQLLTPYTYPHILRRMLDDLHMHSCKEGHEPIISFEGLEQLHRFIFVMAVTHISYSCLTILLAIVKIRSWRAWEDEAHNDRPNSLNETTKELTVHRQTTLVRFCKSNLLARNTLLVWVTCFFRQFGRSVVRIDYLALRKRFIMVSTLVEASCNNISWYLLHVRVVGCMQYACTTIFYMIRYMEEEFQKIVGVSGPLWGFVVAFMLFNIDGSNLYFWIAIIPISLVLLVGTKLQRIIATLALENAGNTGLFSRARLASRDELFWFNKPELLLPLIHFILFQNSFELASFFWTWWQFGYKSCIMRNHLLVYLRLIFGFAGQFLCSYSTLPLYALVTQMGTNYKAALIPECIRETMHGSEEEARSRRKRRRHDMFTDDSTIHSDTSTFVSIEEDYDGHTSGHDVELQPTRAVTPANNRSSRVVTPHHKYSASVSSSVVLESVSSSVVEPSLTIETIPRSSSLPKGRYDQ